MARKNKAQGKYTSILPQLVAEYDENGDPILPGVMIYKQDNDGTVQPAFNTVELVRLRPGMYIGYVDTRGLHSLFQEIIENSVGEVFAGHCTEIDVVLGEDYTISVSDNGRGIPVNIIEGTRKSGVELAFTDMHSSHMLREYSHKVPKGLRGPGASAVNALSEWLVCEVKRDSKVYRMRFERGMPITPLEVIGDCGTEEQGTKVTWLADKTMFKPALTDVGELTYDGDLIARRCQELAYHLPNTRITFHDRLHGKSLETFHYPDGIADYVQHLNQGHKMFPSKPILLHGSVGDTRVTVALQCTDSGCETILSFANARPTPDNGTHVNGFLRALTKVRKEWIVEGMNHNTSQYGLTAVISVFTTHPMYNSADTIRLMNPEIDVLVFATVYAGLTEYFRYDGKRGYALRDELNAFVSTSP